MGSESDLEELHTSILSLCEEDSQAKTLNQTFDLSPIKHVKSNDRAFTDTLSQARAEKLKCSSTEFTPSHVIKSDKKFLTRAHSTPLMPKRLCQSSVTSESEQETVNEEEEDESKDQSCESTYEDLLSEVTVLCGLPQNCLLSSKGPPKLKIEESVKNLNQTQLSKIDIDSILFVSDVPNDKLEKEEALVSETSECSQDKTPGRFAGLCSVISVSSVDVEEEDLELSEDILGLDEYIYSELDSDDDFDEETLLSADDTMLHDKTLSKDAGVGFAKRGSEVLTFESDPKNDDVSSSDDTVLDLISDSEDNQNVRLTSGNETDDAKSEVDINANTVAVGKKRKESDFENKGHSKRTKLEDGLTAVILENREEDKKSEKSESDVEYVISLNADSESDFDSKSDKDDVDDGSMKTNKVQNTVSSKAKIPMVCVSPLIKQEEERCEEEKNSKEDYNVLIDYKKERSFLKNENDLTRSVMKKWKSSGIHNPDKNLTFASAFRKSNNGIKGRLEGFHLSTLHGDAVEKDLHQNSPTSRSLAESIGKLKKDMHDYEQCHYFRLQEMKMDFRARMEHQTNRNRHRIRRLQIQQEMEVRSVYYQHIDPLFKQCQLMQLKADHQTQMGHIQCVALNEEKTISDEYFHKVELERRRFEEQYDQMASLVEQLGQSEFEEKDEQFGPHVMVNLVKAPCRNNHEKKSQVSVYLPLDIANAMLKEDKLYDSYYEY
jgi:hypothetical protein